MWTVNVYVRSSVRSGSRSGGNSSMIMIIAVVAAAMAMILTRCPPAQKLRWQWKNPPFEDVFPLENGDFPMSCQFSWAYPDCKTGRITCWSLDFFGSFAGPFWLTKTWRKKVLEEVGTSQNGTNIFFEFKMMSLGFLKNKSICCEM